MFATRSIQILSPVLLVAAIILLVLPFYATFVVASALGSLLGLILIWAIVDRPTELRFSWALCAALLLAYAGGSLSSWFNSSSTEDFLIIAKQRPEELLSGTLSFVFISCACTLLLGRWEVPVFHARYAEAPNARFGIVLSFFGSALIAAAYLTGNLGYEGLKADASTQNVSALGAIAYQVTAPLLGVIGFVYGKTNGTLSKLYCLVVGGLVFLSVVPSGRRQIVLAFILAGIGYALSGCLGRRSRTQKTLIAVVMVVFGYFLTSYFFAVRLAVWELGSQATLTEQLGLAYDFITSPALEGRFDSLLYENLRERTFVIGYLSDLIEATWRSGPLYGETLLYYIKLSIPSVLDQSKVDILALMQVENFVHPKLGLPVIDQANTVLTDGVSDFSVAGGLLYLLGILIYLVASAWLVRQFARTFTVLFGLLTLVHLALKPELGLSDYFVTFRNLLAVMPIILLLEYLVDEYWQRTSVPLEPSIIE